MAEPGAFFSRCARARGILCLVLWQACSGAAAAAEAWLQAEGIEAGPVGVLEDPDGEATLEAVMGRTGGFHALGAGIANLGFTSSAYWFRLEVRNRRERPATLVLDVRNPTLDDLTLHVVRTGDGTDIVRSGDRIAAAERPYHATTVALPFELKRGESATLYLRVRAEAAAMVVPFALMDEAGMQTALAGRALLNGMLAGLFGSLFLYNLLVYLLLRESSYLYYVAYLPFAYLGTSILNGFLGSLPIPLPTWWFNEGLLIVSAFAFVLITLFTRAFLRTPEHPLLDAGVKLLVGLSLLIGLLPLLLPVAAAYAIAASILFVFPLLCLVIGVAAWTRGETAARFYILGQAASWIGLAGLGLLLVDVLPFWDLGFDLVSIGVAVDALLLSLALADRIRALQKAKVAAEDAARRNLELRQHELEHMVAARTAELELARRDAVRMATTDALTGIHNRRGLLALADREVKLAVRGARPLAAIAFDLDHFKRVNDTHGHAEGDRVLRAVAEAVLKEIRTTDLFGRVGGEEFLLVLPETSPEAAAQLAERIRLRLTREVVVGHPPAPVTASLGVARLDGTGTLESLQSDADAALYRAKQGGRNRVEIAA